MIVDTIQCPECSLWIVVNTLETQNPRGKTCNHCNATFSFANNELDRRDVPDELANRGYFKESEIRYMGVICPNGHFIKLRPYAVEHPGSPFSASLTLDHATEFTCEKCGSRDSYVQSDIVHSNSLDGKDAKYQDER